MKYSNLNYWRNLGRLHPVVTIDEYRVDAVAYLGLRHFWCSVVEQPLEVSNDAIGYLWADFVQTFHLLPHRLQQPLALCALTAWQTQLNSQTLVNLGVHHSCNLVALRALAEFEMCGNRVQDAYYKRHKAYHYRCGL